MKYIIPSNIIDLDTYIVQAKLFHKLPTTPPEYIIVINPGNHKAIATKSYVVNVS